MCIGVASVSTDRQTFYPMIYGYIRVSTDKQTTENQRFEILGKRLRRDS